MTRIYLVRHGQTEWNRQERFRGHIDIPLNEVGHTQAQSLAAYLQKKPITAVFTSPLQRALQTAIPIAHLHNLSPVALAEIVDIDYGAWQSFSPAEVRERYPDLLAQWYTAPNLVKIPGGEILESVKRRATSALHITLIQHDTGEIVLVTHQIVIKVLVCALLDLDLGHIWRIRQDNACLDIFDWDGTQFTAILINGTDHLHDAN